MHKAQYPLQVPVPNIQEPVQSHHGPKSSSNNKIKVPISSHLCAFETQSSLHGHTVYIAAATLTPQRRQSMHTGGEAKKNNANHNACKEKRNHKSCKEKRNHNACMSCNLLLAKKKRGCILECNAQLRLKGAFCTPRLPILPQCRVQSANV